MHLKQLSDLKRFTLRLGDLKRSFAFLYSENTNIQFRQSAKNLSSGQQNNGNKLEVNPEPDA
jgi:hypothetical protein